MTADDYLTIITAKLPEDPAAHYWLFLHPRAYWLIIKTAPWDQVMPWLAPGRTPRFGNAFVIVDEELPENGWKICADDAEATELDAGTLPELTP
jgi:hypothetical protein